MHRKFILKDESATQALGKSLALCMQAGLSIFLHGDLGAGKTCLTRAILHALGHAGHVKSPTYTLVEPYHLHIEEKPVTLMHFDLYRMISPEEFIEAGFREEFNDSNICIVEWPEKADGILSKPDIELFLSITGNAREVELQALSDKGNACLALLQFAPNL